MYHDVLQKLVSCDFISKFFSEHRAVKISRQREMFHSGVLWVPLM